MAKYTITHKCGHQEEHQIGGKVRERDGKKEWMEDRLCTECYLKEQTEQRERDKYDANKKAGEFLKKRPGLPELKGSEKQIAWANTIRAGLIEQADALKNNLNENNDSEDARKIRGLFSGWYQTFITNDSAKWWIDNRPVKGDTRAAYRFMRDYLKKQPEVQEYEAREKEKIERKKSDHIVKVKAYVDQVVEDVKNTEWSKYNLENDTIKTPEGRTIVLAQGEGNHVIIRTIDGSSKLEYDGEFVAWIDRMPEFQTLSPIITKIDRDQQKSKKRKVEIIQEAPKTKLSGEKPKTKITVAQVKEVQESRSERSRKMDATRSNKNVRTMDNAEPWTRHPDRYDLKGVDTPKKQRGMRGKAPGPRINKHGVISRKAGKRVPGTISK